VEPHEDWFSEERIEAVVLQVLEYFIDKSSHLNLIVAAAHGDTAVL
jgi:hypothetical protein